MTIFTTSFCFVLSRKAISSWFFFLMLTKKKQGVVPVLTNIRLINYNINSKPHENCEYSVQLNLFDVFKN